MLVILKGLIMVLYDMHTKDLIRVITISYKALNFLNVGLS